MAKKKVAKVKKRKASRAKPRKKQTMHGCRKCGKHWVGPPNLDHLCVPPSEERVFADTEEELLEAWKKLREYAASLGTQRIYPSQKAVMFARKVCYFFVHPKKKYLELSIFLKTVPRHPLVHKSVARSKVRHCVTVRITHADHIEEPLTDWLAESFNTCSGSE